MIPLDKLVTPISSENPCGQDLFLDGSLMQLEQLIKTQLDAEEAEVEPDWREVREESLALLERSKDLRVGVILCLALLRLEGLAGFRDGLALLRGWVDKFWESVFPLLDASDPQDPTRIFVFNNLSASLATDTPYKFVKYLRLVRLCEPAHLSPYNLRDIVQAQAKRGGEESGEKAVPTSDQIDAAFRDTPVERLQKMAEFVDEMRKAVADLEALVTEKSAEASGPSWEPLKQTLEAMRNSIAPYLAPLQTSPSTDPIPGAGLAATTPAATQTVFSPGGPIHSRGEAEAAMRAAAEYFRRHEPSSATPLLIDRAVRLIGKNFLDCMAELAIGSPDDFKRLFGALPEKSKEEP